MSLLMSLLRISLHSRLLACVTLNHHLLCCFNTGLAAEGVVAFIFSTLLVAGANTHDKDSEGGNRGGKDGKTGFGGGPDGDAGTEV